MTEANVGCGECWPVDATSAWRARGGLTCELEPIDESHLHVMVLACPRCGQRFVSVFTETIDWVGGHDAQHWTLLPLTPDEVAQLAGAGGSLTEAAVRALGPGRRRLYRDFPTTGEPRVWWGAGTVGPRE